MYGRQMYKDWKRGGKRIFKPEGFVEARKLFDAATKRPGKGWQADRKRRGLALADFRIPTRTVWKGTLPTSEFCLGKRKFKWEDWAAFLGIWLAEGSCLGASQGAPSSGEYRVQIAQSKQAHRATYRQIEALLKRMGLKYRAKSDRILFTDKDIWTYLTDCGTNSYTKCVPQWVKDAPASIIQVFIDWAMAGDGTLGPRGKRIYVTVSKQLADDMQELFQKAGSSATVHLRTVKKNLRSNFGVSCGWIYQVEEMLRAEVSIIPDVGRGKQRMPERIPYSGYVYCAMVPNGTLYCRENGRPFWSGNTFMWWEQPQSESHVQIVRRYIQNELEGQAKLSIIAGMKKPEIVEVTPVQEADLLLNWQELLIRMIGNAFRMSAMALGIEHDVNRAVGQVLADADFRSAVVPMAKRLQGAFTRKILHERLGWYDLEFAFTNLDDPDIETKMGMYQQLYSMNATTPNRVLKALNMQELDSPLADLTQFECMMLNMEAMSKLQSQAADQQMNRQQQQMQQQQQMMQDQYGPPDDNGPGGGGGGSPFPPAGGMSPAKLTPGDVARGGQPPSPKPLSLPKFPIAGSRYTAKQVAQMPINQVTDVWHASGRTASEFLQSMDDQEPGILQQLTDEVKVFFQQALAEEEAEQKKKKRSMRLLNKWKKELMIKVRRQDKRSDDLASYLHDLGTKLHGRPGAAGRAGGAGTDYAKPRSQRKPPAGTPGKLYL
jgi:hypothetical protein